MSEVRWDVTWRWKTYNSLAYEKLELRNSDFQGEV